MKRYVTASAIALIAMSGQAFADVTPQQVWDDLQAYMTEFGYDVGATETVDGDTLVLGDLGYSMSVPEDDMMVKVAMQEMSLTDNGDGTVTLSFPDTSEVMVDIVEGGDKVGEIVLVMGAPGFTTVISGEINDMTYTFSGENISYELVKLIADGTEVTRDMLRVDLAMGPVSGSASMKNADGMRSTTTDVTYGDLTYDVAFDNPESDTSGLFKGFLNGLAASGTSAIPKDIDFEDPMAIFAGGLSVDMVLSYADSMTEFVVNDYGDVTQFKSSGGGGELGVAVSQEELVYAVSSSNVAFDMSGPDLPLPISASWGEAGFSLAMPLQKADTPQDAAISIVLGDLAISDLLWNIFDPGAVLPRDPATVALNLEAQVTPFADLFNEKEIEEAIMTKGMPGELNAVTLTDFVVDVAGGSIFGAGEFTFDNSDLTSFDGLPRPEGALELELAGANGLIDNLIAMGLLPEEQAMPARMMLGMFTVPGAEPDTATSKIEVNAEGHVLANGQRIK